MFTDPGRSPWDLSFRLFGVPVRVHPMFWLMSAILYPNTPTLNIPYLLVWVACVFVSILIHEMGHVVLAGVFGVRGEIVLYGFGGLAMNAGQMRSRWQHVLVCLAGPLAGFLFLGLVILCLPLVAPELWDFLKYRVQSALGQPAEHAVLLAQDVPKIIILGYLVWINLLWGVVNLLPIWPLDGGQISRDIFTFISPRSGASVAYGVSLVLAGLIAVDTLMAMNGRPILPIRLPIGGLWTVLMFGYLAVGSFMALQEEQSRRNWMDERVQRWDHDDEGRW
jgi:Zn-dependent protease